MRETRRILIVDDNPSIHEDFKKVLITTASNSDLEVIEEALFDEGKRAQFMGYDYQIDDAFQGEGAIEMVEKADDEGFPYSLVYMDVRMPPGMDGVETIDRIWRKYPNIEMVICSAYSDYSWDEILNKFGQTDKLLFVKKPFNIIVIKQLTLSLVTKWDIAKQNREYMEHLEKEVQERTKELRLLLEKMKTLKEKAEEADRLKSVFLANMSHEIRSPMNSILGFTDLLANREITEEERRLYLSYISSSGKSLLNLINDIIFVAKIEAGVLELNMTEFSLNHLLKEIKEIFTIEKNAQKKDEIALVLNLGTKDEYSYIVSDAERLKQILVNLLTNALKFTQKGEIVFGYTVDNTGENLTFYVKDTGIGIPEDKQDIIFERFGQVNDAIVKSNGTGLGLTISKNLVGLLNGKMWVESKYQEGSIFYFMIPFKAAEQQQKLENQKKTDVQNLPFREKTTTILIAEDDEVNWVLLEQMLTPLHATLIRAKDGLQAVELFKSSNNIDLVLMDIKMPVMDGVEATRQIKQFNPAVPVIAQTAYAMADEEKMFREQNFDDYIAKPINMKELFSKIECWLMKKLSEELDSSH